jgi:carbamoylphosphate synthase large subunit
MSKGDMFGKACIITTKHRELFTSEEFCGYQVAESSCCCNVDEAYQAASKIGYPVLVRPAFAVGVWSAASPRMRAS